MKKITALRQLLPLTLSLLATVTTTRAIATAPADLHAQAVEQSQPIDPQPQMQPVQLAQIEGFGLPVWVYLIGGGVLLLIFLPRVGWIAGLIVIGEREVGIVTKKFSAKSLPPNRLMALNGEAGLQADTLPPGWHFGYFPWQYNVNRDLVVVVPQGEIGLIVANDGATLPLDRILAKVTDCDNFQDARKFSPMAAKKGDSLRS